MSRGRAVPSLAELIESSAMRDSALERIMFGDADAQALSRTHSDLSDIDPASLARARAGEADAYDRAARIANGTLDPLSGRD